VRRESPASYLKVCAMLVPKEMKVEHSAAAYIKELTDEQLEACIATLKEIIERKDSEATNVIEEEAQVVPSLPAPGSGGTKMPKAEGQPLQRSLNRSGANACERSPSAARPRAQ
jgi:hypothetical protein